MKKKTKVNPEKMYITDRLEEKMSQMSRYPLVVAEAPIGFGKTTGIRAFMKKSCLSHIWISVLDSSSYYFWLQFCGAFKQIDEKLGTQIEEIGVPSDSVKACIVAGMLNNLSLDRDVFIVIDDYQLVFSDELNGFFEILARENIPYLHVVLAGRRRFPNNREELIVKNLLMTITEPDFKLNEEECKSYFEECGVSVSPSETREIYKNTEGWITALYMVMLSYIESGNIVVPEDLFGLLENSIYRKYSPDQQDFLLRVCIFNRFSAEQARFMRRKDDPLKILESIVDSNGFIRYDSKLKNYHIHTLFAQFLREKLSEKNMRFRNEVYRHAADWHYLNRNFFLATIYYYNSRNFEDMLKSFERDRGRSLSGKSGKVMIEAFEACPDEIRHRHPIAEMIYVKQLSLMHETERAEEMLKDMEKHFNSDNLTEREKEEFRGEYYMLLSYFAFNDLKKMSEYQKTAAKYLRKSSSIVDRRGSWTYGAPSVLYMFYRTPGSLEELIKDMYDSRDFAYRLTDNNGRGCEYMLDAESEFMHNCLDKAEILSFKACAVAKKYDQTGIIICAMFLLAQIAVLRGDTDKALDGMKEMRDIVTDNGEFVFFHTLDLCTAHLYAVHNQIKPVESWILRGKFENITLLSHAVNYVYIVYGRILLNREEYSSFLGIADNCIQMARENSNLVTEIYMHIYSAIAYEKMHMSDYASEHLERAVREAYEDSLYMPFVENGKVLFELGIRENMISEEKVFFEECRKIYGDYEKNINIHLKEDDSSPLNLLTRREQEIALLVSDGKTNQEIADELNIAEITVKKSLSNIYARFGINNRTSLMKKLKI